MQTLEIEGSAAAINPANLQLDEGRACAGMNSARMKRRQLIAHETTGIPMPPSLFGRARSLPSPVPRTVTKEALFRRLIREYGSSLYYFVLKRVGHPDEAADIAQQAFVEAACGLTSFRGEAELSTWIFGIATNLARNHLSRAPQNRHHFETDEVLETCESAELDPSDNVSQRQGLQLVTEAMRQLPPEMAHALHLVAVEELSYEAAAEELKVPVGTVRSRVSRARASVRQYLRKVGFNSPGL